MRVVFLQIFLTLPSCFLLGMMIPLNLAQSDSLGAGNSFCSLQNLHRILLISQATLQLNRLKWHCISQRNICHLCMTLPSAGIRETHHELLSKLLATPTDKLPLLYAPRSCKAP